MGELHPEKQKALGLRHRVLLAVGFIEDWPAARHRVFSTSWPPAPHMPVYREFGFLLPADVAVEPVMRAMAQQDRRLIQAVELVDVFDDPEWKGTQRAYAFRLTLQPQNAAFTDEQLQALSHQVIDVVKKTWGGVLRLDAQPS